MTSEDSNRKFSCHFRNERLGTVENMRLHLIACASKTDQCPHCKKYILRSIFAYHIDQNCTNLDFLDQTTEESSNQLSNDFDQIEIKNTTKFEPLFEKRVEIRQSLIERCYLSEVDHVEEKVQFNIIVMGSPRVGKSTLINAICNSNEAQTSASLDSCTQKITCYTLKDNQQRYHNVKPFEIHFYDTPGIESWKEKNGEITMLQFIEKINPLCVIYCASPGAFACLTQLHSILEYCKDKDIFCALVCTNIWCSGKRDHVINEFKKQLEFFGTEEEKECFLKDDSDGHKITFFGKGALCTMVNSERYSDKALLGDRVLTVKGIDELIHGIMQGLNEDKLLGWCYAVLYRRSYWQIITQKAGGFFQLRFDDMQHLIVSSYEETVKNFTNYFSKKTVKTNKK